MIQSYLEKTKRLQSEAKSILANADLWNILSSSGIIHATGSFDLGLLVWPDLDIYFEPNDNRETITIFSDFVKFAAKDPNITTVKLEKELHKKCTLVPNGTFLQIKIKEKETLWKVDIWIFEKDYLNEKLAEIKALKDTMTEQEWTLILQRKHEMINSKGRTPSFSSYLLYKAVLEEGLSSLNDIKEFIRGNGVQV